MLWFLLAFICLHEDHKLEYKRVGFQEENENCQKFFKFYIVTLQETKREIWDRRFVGSVWKGRNREWLFFLLVGL